MSYLPLARKYRPRFFSDFVGQEAVIKGLTHALLKQTMASAYLLTGTRGIGKTTLARLIAMAVNCEKGISQEPCNLCESCVSTVEGNNPDVYEVDGASKTKVEEMRTLLENTQYLPLANRYKVYIIDEVHMLSTHSFNALLKTLEEPYPHILFVLATTELEKIPMTVRSRCMHYALLPFETAYILKQCQTILNAENIPYDDELLRVAQAGRGSMRDALTLLEQIIQIGQGSALAPAVNQLLKSIPQHQWDEFIAKLTSPDREALASSLKSLQATQPSPKDFLEKLLQHWFNLSLEPNGNIKQYSELYDLTLHGFKQLANCPDPGLHLQMIWLRLWQTIHHHPHNITVNITHYPANDKMHSTSSSLSKVPKAPGPEAQSVTSATEAKEAAPTAKPTLSSMKAESSADHMHKPRLDKFEALEEFQQWLARVPLPTGLLGEAIKQLSALRIQKDTHASSLILAYSATHGALFHATTVKKLMAWFKVQLPNETIEIVASETTMAPTPRATSGATEQVALGHTDRLSPEEKKQLDALGYSASAS